MADYESSPDFFLSFDYLFLFDLFCFFLQLQMSHKQESRVGRDSKAKLNAVIFLGGGGVYSLLSFHK